MATQDLILTRPQSCLINVGRIQIVAGAGDFWLCLNDYSVSNKFTIAHDYNTLEAQIDDTINSGYLVKETLGDGTLQGIGKAPQRPHPSEQ